MRGGCDFYDEIENILSCGANGFAQGHAKHYCNRFDSMIDTFDNKVGPLKLFSPFVKVI